ncbi:MAG: hypothetical protein ACR2LY_10080 [Thermoleophilaceae bacterium]
MSVEIDRELARIEAGAALDKVVGELDRAGWAVEFVDGDWTLRWISQGLRTLIGEFDDERLGIGRHVFEALQLPTWDAAVTRDSGLRFMAVNVPYMAYEHPEGLDGILAMSDGRPEAGPLAELVPAPPPPVWVSSEDLGSDSGAARAAIDAGRAVSEAVDQAAAELASAGVPLRPEECVMGVGVHWGGALYIGQVVTGGRLEVTALGDEMNECARIEQSSSDGEVLASKGLVERLSSSDADALGLDGERLRYRTVAELPGAGEKAIRDAGGVAVAEVGASP